MTIFEQLATWWEKYRDLVIKIAMISLAAVTTTFVYLFQRPVMPDGWAGDVVAAASAISLVLIYVGLAVAKLDEGRRKRVMWVAVAAAAIETIYGTIHVAIEIYSKNNPGTLGLLDGLPDWAAWGLGFLHAAPFSILLFLVAQFVFHDPTKDQHFLEKLTEALAKIEEQAAELLGLRQDVKNAEANAARLQADNQLLQQLRDQDAASNTSNREALQSQLLLLQAQVDELQADKAGLLEVIDTLSNSSNSNNGHENGSVINYTKKITELLEEHPDLTNQELYEMTGFPQGSLKVIASRVRKKLDNAVNN